MLKYNIKDKKIFLKTSKNFFIIIYFIAAFRLNK